MIRARNFIFAALMLPQITSAGGSVSWDDVVPLLSQNRKLQSFVEMTFDVVPAGTATRLGKQFENLDGQRVAPYVFSAKPRGSGDGYPFNLVIDAEIQFLDAEGNALDESGAEINAAQIRQVLAGIRLEPVEESEAQAKLSEEIATARTKQIREWFNDINLRDARISAIEFADESVPIEAKAVYHRHPKSGSLELITVDGSLGDHSGFSESFYFMEGELFFVYRQENHWTFHPQNPNSTIDSVKEERFHFYQGAIYEGLAKEYEGGGPEKLQQAQQAAETKPIPLNGSEANRFYSRASRLVIARSPKDCANIYIDVFR
tara:strand:- start:11758 stop:12711 length:954 start_codon:yes stop_codon:yes gene_type:complete